MNVLKREKQVAVIRCLVEGMGIRSIERTVGVHRDTALRLIGRAGEHCARLHDEHVRSVPARYIQADELWSFAGKKQGRLSDLERRNPALGDQFIWIGLDEESKLVVSYRIGKRDQANATQFMLDLRARLNEDSRVQITTDGLWAYVDAVNWAFGRNVDFAQQIKQYRAVHPGPGRYAPPRVSGMVSTVISGNPNGEHVSTSLAERHNLCMRTCLRRLTRLSLGYTKKLDNLVATMQVYATYYNFVKPHVSLGGITPAMAAGIETEIWAIDRLVGF